MIETDLILVDTHIILDVYEEDPHWADWSVDQLSRIVGRAGINPLIYTELSFEAGEIGDVETMLVTLGLIYHELPREALYLATKAYKTYRQRGGSKTAPLPDFLSELTPPRYKFPFSREMSEDTEPISHRLT